MLNTTKHTQKVYKNYKKPSWSPPAWLFGPVWTGLYILIFISYFTVFWKYIQGEISFLIILPFILNLIFNFSFTYFQFSLKNNYLATLDIILVWLSLVWLSFVIFPIYPWVSYIQIPYFLWVSFATILQLRITYLNR